MIVVACLIILNLNGRSVEVMGTGQLIREHGQYWNVDVSHSVEAYGLDSKNYHNYLINSDQCSKKEIK